MSNDTDTSSASSNSSIERKKRKISKKHKSGKKHKKEKKLKRHKEKKRSKYNSQSQIQAKNTPTVSFSALAMESDETAFGPTLPPHLLPKTEVISTPEKSVIGPVLPSDYLKIEKEQEDNSKDEQNEASNDEDFDYGPLPVGNDMNAAQIEREQRALELKIAAMEGRGLNQETSDQKSREEWMLELPEVGLRSGLAALSNMKRTFHTGKEKPDFSDRSDWTKTPQSESNEQKPTSSKSSVDSLKQKAELLYESARDAEQERLAKKHKKKHKREESLVELHQKKLRKEQKQKEKELAASGAKPERRPFSREVDLKLNKIDKNQTKQIVDKAKILDSKFYTGKTKYL